MSFSYDLALTSNKDKVRNMVDDTVDSGHTLEDEEINSFLGIYAQDLCLSAAACLRKIASSRALLARRRKAGNYEEDLRDIVRGLLQVAKMFQDLAADTPFEATAQEILTDFNYRDIVRNKSLRNESLD